MSRTFKNFLFFMVGFLIMLFAGIASAEECVDLTSWGAAIYEGSSSYTGCNYMLLSISEYDELINSVGSSSSGTLTLDDLFMIPEQTQLAEGFKYGFSLVLIAYLVSWGYGFVINWFRPEHDRY